MLRGDRCTVPTPLWVSGLTQYCFHLFSLECDYYNGLNVLLTAFVSLKSKKDFWTCQRFHAEARKEPVLRRGNFYGKRGASYSMLPSTASTPHWASLVQKSSHTAFTIRTLMAHKQCRNAGHWNYLYLFKDFPVQLLSKIEKDGFLF